MVLRFGVEEEFLLANPASRMTVAKAHLVVPRAVRVLGERAQHEFLDTQVEGCTPPVGTAVELRAELIAMREQLVRAAEEADCLLVASGTAVLPSRHPLPVTDRARYHRVAAHVGPIADQVGGELCGCHVHLGDLDRAEALALSARLRPWLPVLQALCANSPFCEGRNGAASSRSLRYRAWPTCGPAPALDEGGYERLLGWLTERKVILDRRMLYWYARPSEHLPTLEVRVADTNADVDTIVLYAVLLRGLAHTMLAAQHRGRPRPPVRPGALRTAHRLAALGGLTGTGVDPCTGAAVPMERLVERLLEQAAPGLELTGDLVLARTLTHRLLATGTGAQRQRAVFARNRSLPEVVDHLAYLTARSGRSVVGRG
ncbi:Putative glutamate--cysteine ligase 2 [Kitasatospora sp. MMS16-BH015]|nr:Putative glutamate--cysteine ligase 2 [Kitasatospora sp. MMS16-BH015]